MIKNEKGLTLVEILASIVILSIVLTSFYGLFIQSAKFTKVNEDNLVASNLANQVREKLISGSFPDTATIETSLKSDTELNLDSNYIFTDYPNMVLELDLTAPVDDTLHLLPVTISISKADDLKNPIVTTYCYTKVGS